MRDVKSYGKEAKAETFPLIDILPVERNTFYRYDGSLTTPGCNEIVKWTVFRVSQINKFDLGLMGVWAFIYSKINSQNPIDISRPQMAAFRELTQENKYLVNNFRPAQPLNGRVVYDMDSTPLVRSNRRGSE